MTNDEIKPQSNERRIAWDLLRNSATGRMTAALNGRLWPSRFIEALSRQQRAGKRSVESDTRYYERRSKEEGRAAKKAVSKKAHDGHAKLAQLYAALVLGAEAPLSATQH